MKEYKTNRQGPFQLYFDFCELGRVLRKKIGTLNQLPHTSLKILPYLFLCPRQKSNHLKKTHYWNLQMKFNKSKLKVETIGWFYYVSTNLWVTIHCQQWFTFMLIPPRLPREESLVLKLLQWWILLSSKVATLPGYNSTPAPWV